MNEFQAAMGLCNLRHVDREIEKRRIVCEEYLEKLSNIKGIKLCDKEFTNTTEKKHNYAYLPVLFEDYKYSRDEVWERLKAEDITARKYFWPLTCDFECYADCGFKEKYPLPVARKTAGEVLTLPVYADLALEDVDRICSIILS